MRTSRASVVALLLLASAVYAQTMRGEFQFDDSRAIVWQPGIKHFAWASFPGGWLSAGRPVTNVTFALNYAIGRLDPAGYHAVNVAIHLAAIILVWAFARRIARLAGAGRGEWIALGIAGAFALHPIQTEAVSYVVQRSEPLASVLYVAALLLVLEAERLGPSRGGVAAFAGALACFVLGLGAKAIVVTMPAAYLLVAWAVAGGRDAGDDLTTWPRRTILVLPFAFAAAMHACVTIRALRGRDAGFHVPGVSSWHYLLTETRAVVVYLRLLFWPAGQSVDWQFPLSRSFSEPAVLASGALLVTFIGAAFALLVVGRRHEGAAGGAARLVGLGIFWFFLVLCPTSSFVPLADALVEHRLYLASFGVFLAAAAGLERLTASLDARGTRIAAGTIGALLCVLALLSSRRNAVWDTREALWRDVLAGRPANARARLNLGWALAQQGRLGEAIAEYDAAIPLEKDDGVFLAATFRNLAAAHSRLGHPAAALAALERGLEVAPDDEDLLVNLGIERMKAGDVAGAEPPIRRALEVAPSEPAAWNVLGTILISHHDLAGALGALDHAAALDPDLGEVQLNRAMVFDALGRTADACAARREAIAGRLLLQDRADTERLVGASCRSTE